MDPWFQVEIKPEIRKFVENLFWRDFGLNHVILRWWIHFEVLDLKILRQLFGWSDIPSFGIKNRIIIAHDKDEDFQIFGLITLKTFFLRFEPMRYQFSRENFSAPKPLTGN